MKRLIFGLIIFLYFAVISGYCSGKKDIEIKDLKEKIARLESDKVDLNEQISYLRDHTERLTPITLERVNQAGRERLARLDYYLSAPLMLVSNNPDTKVDEKDGILFIKDTNFNRLDRIENTVKGKYEDYFPNPMDKESFEISFPGGSEVFTLKFERDKVKNNFALVAVLTPKNVSFSSGGILPYLCILLDYKNEGQDPVYQISSGTQGTSASVSNQNDRPETGSSIRPIPSSRNIIAYGILTRDCILGYIKSKNTSISSGMIETIVNTYIDEAGKENVNLDIAIAQMCEGTNFLNNLSSLSTNNYGDLHDIKNTKLKASFPSMLLGIKVHIQQLKYYANPAGLTYPAADQPRLRRIEKNRGKYPTLDQLFSVWVSKDHAAYRNSINSILNEMYNFQKSVT